MLEKNDRAFKEWAVIVTALAAGRQSVILRKGGISEETGSFSLENREFFLFPTYVHQQERGVIPEERIDLRKLQAEAPPGGVVSIGAYAQVVEAVWETNLEKLKALERRHIWDGSVVKERFEWGGEDGLHVLLVRVYRLSEPVHLPLLDAYGGCKSWVTLEHPLSTAGATPVLDEDAFSKESQAIRRALGRPV